MIIETNFGTKVDPQRMAIGSATNVTKRGAFYVFSIRVDSDDIREYSFTDRGRATAMREAAMKRPPCDQMQSKKPQ